MKLLKCFSLLLAATLLPMSMSAQVINGDLNHNGDLDVEDITLLINGYLTGEKEYFNGDNDKVHEAVDLGLSVKWATMNIGANAPEDYGDHFAWGETTAKKDYSWSTYKWCQGTDKTLTNYNTSSDYSYSAPDNKTQLELVDDAAYVNWGGTWRMPTDAELTELRTKCTWTWMSLNGVNGMKVAGPSGNSIFLPAAGYCDDTSLYDEGSYGSYWSSSLNESTPNLAWGVYFDSSGANRYCSYRYFGQSVRAVCP